MPPKFRWVPLLFGGLCAAVVLGLTGGCTDASGYKADADREVV